MSDPRDIEPAEELRQALAALLALDRSPTIPEMRPLVSAYYGLCPENICGGSLHIVLDDGRDSQMTERLTESQVNEREPVIMRAVRLAYRLGRQDQQRYVESACCKQLDDEHLALLLHGFACDFPDESVCFESIIRAAEFDSTAVNSDDESEVADG